MPHADRWKRPGGGTHIGKGYGDVPRSWPPFFRPVAAPQPTNLPSMRRSCPGGTHIGKGYGDVPRLWPPFFQASRRSLAYQFTLNEPLVWPPFSIFRKFVHFQPCFGQNSNSLDQNFSTFSFPKPPFARKIRSLDPTFWNPRGIHPPKKKIECPPLALLCPLFSICRKFLHFQPCFSQNFSSLDPNFLNFRSQDPQFQGKTAP